MMDMLMGASASAQNYTMWIARIKSDLRPLCNRARCDSVEVRKNTAGGRNRCERYENDVTNS